MKYICTYFDINFMPRGMALLDSLEKHTKEFTLYILALDTQTKIYFEKLNHQHIVIITLEEYMVYFNIDKSKYRNKKEFYFSITPSICLYILENYKDIDLLLYLDADVYLFNELEMLYDEIGDASIAMCSQRLPWYTSKKYGMYNVGVNAFRKDREGLACLKQWHEDCSTWKPNQEGYSLDFFSDQIWLDKWPFLYENLKIIEHIGIDTAPWNAIQYKFLKQDNTYYVDGKPLVLYHFSSLKQLDDRTWHVNTIFTIFNLKESLYNIYEEYINNIIKYRQEKDIKVLGLSVSGNKIKIFVYIILRLFHKHTIEIREK